MNHTLHRENSYVLLLRSCLERKGKDDIHLLCTFDFRGLKTRSFLIIKPNKTMWPTYLKIQTFMRLKRGEIVILQRQKHKSSSDSTHVLFLD